MEILLNIALKLTIGFFALFAITKILGKTQISQITPFDFISSIALGELLGNAVYDRRIGLVDLGFALSFWGLLVYLAELLGQKFLNLRSFFEGNPSIVVRDGVVDRRQLKRNKININQLQNLLRQKDIFWIGDVKYAILEPNGSLSVLKYSGSETPTRTDFKIPESPTYLPVVLISDGKALNENLKTVGHDLAWLETQVAMKNCKIEEVFYAEWREDKGLSVSMKFL